MRPYVINKKYIFWNPTNLLEKRTTPTTSQEKIKAKADSI